MTEIYR